MISDRSSDLPGKCRHWPGDSFGRIDRHAPRTCTLRTRFTARRIAKTLASASVAHDWFFQTEHDLALEVKSMEAEGSDKPALLFIHGAGHGAWCWQEYFMPYFHERGYTSHALSLRGQAKSEMLPGSKSGGTLDDHSGDISHFIKATFKEPPILVGHSFGGLISQAYILRDFSKRARVRGVALLAAAPPQGSNAMIKRFLTQRPLQAIMLTWSFINKSYLKNTVGAKRLFFSDDLPESDAQRFLELLQENKSKLPAVEVSKFKEQTPLPPYNPGTPPVLVLGGDSDYTVDVEGLKETADHYGVQPVILPDLAHDLMLDTRWERVAETLHRWVDTLPTH